MNKIVNNIAKLIDVKSIVTLTMTVGMLIMLFGNVNAPQEAVTLFSTAYGSIITYFFTKKTDTND